MILVSISCYFNYCSEKCCQNIQFSVNQTLGYPANATKFSKWHLWDKKSVGCCSPAQSALHWCTLPRWGSVQLAFIVKQKSNSGKCLFQNRGHTDVRGELKKRHDDMLCLSNELLFQKLCTRSLLHLMSSFPWLWAVKCESGIGLSFLSIVVCIQWEGWLHLWYSWQWFSFVSFPVDAVPYWYKLIQRNFMQQISPLMNMSLLRNSLAQAPLWHSVTVT